MFKQLLIGLLFLVAFGLWADVKDCVFVVQKPNNQINQIVIPDMAGGAIIVWQDGRTNDYDIYAQRVDHMGNRLWPDNGVVVCNADNDQTFPTVVSDDNGGAVIAWLDNRVGENDIYATRINSNGAKYPSWPVNGLAICTIPLLLKGEPRIAPDGASGGYITWTDDRNVNHDVFVQHVDLDGNLLGTLEGTNLNMDIIDQFLPEICSDGAGGAIISYEQIGNDLDIFAQRVDTNCTKLWSPTGLIVSDFINNQRKAKIVNDGVGSAIITWEDKRNGTDFDIYAQRVLNNAVTWTADGFAISVGAFDQMNATICNTAANTAIIAWQGYTATDANIYAQKVTGTTSASLPWGGAVTATASVNDQLFPQIVSDEAGGGIIVWQDRRDTLATGNDIYGQHLGTTGAFAGEGQTNGYGICTWTSDQNAPMLAFNGYDKAIYAWIDLRNDPIYFDIYTLGQEGDIPLPVELSSFSAVATAQMFVSLQWTTQSETNNLGFNVFRSNDGLLATSSKLNIGIISGTNTTSTQTYSFVDNQIEPESTYYYWLEIVSFDGTSSFSGSVVVNTDNQTPVIPNTTVLRSAYPNPFNARTLTNIEMDVKTGETAKLTIYNVLGQTVRTYVRQAGSYKITWNGRDESGAVCGSGIYFYRLSSPTISSTKKMVIVK